MFKYRGGSLSILLFKFLAPLAKVFFQLHLYYFLSYIYTGWVKYEYFVLISFWLKTFLWMQVWQSRF